MVAEKGQEFYAEFNDFDHNQIFDWLEIEVFPKLIWKNTSNRVHLGNDTIYKYGNKCEIKSNIKEWLEQFAMVEIWADVLAYDWVLFCELFGGAFKIPENIFYTPFDLATLLRLKGRITPNGKYGGDTNRFEFAKIDPNGKQHNALEDARVEMICYHKIMGL